MYSIGREKLKYILGLLFCIILFYSSGAFAENANQHLGGQLESSYSEKLNKKYSGESAFVAGSVDDLEIDKAVIGEGQQVPYNLPGVIPRTVKEKITLNEQLASFGVEMPGKFDKRTNLLTFKDADFLKKIRNSSKSGMSFTYVKDNYNYKDRNGIFERTFEQGTGSIKAGYLFFGFDRYLKKGDVNYAWGGNFGFGFNRGRGFFLNPDGTQSNEQSSAYFNLWTLPVDVSFKMELFTKSKVKLAVSAGPSAMGLYQTRSDRDQGEAKKRRRQIGFGYFGVMALKTDLSILPKSLFNSFEMFSQNQVSRTNLDLFLRYQSYDNFQDQLTIDGVSIGIGFSFEYI
ncbi:MAG: hypothetical protein HN509_05515 [Halobacteriovoraceae bacterium]|jgi:hypothetical protein|nr:hypothetical protein [Halobacteriovoraceae bacterium]MBT5093812.1 hypothetical protein [Halobacteriovoraceae bacterium]